MLARHNRSAEEVAQRLGKAVVGGSDAHALASAGTAYTVVPGARNKSEFLHGLRAGRGVAAGEHGSYAKLTRDVFSIVGAMIQHNPWTSVLLPLAPVIPFYTLAVMLHEAAFERRWSGRAVRRERGRPRTYGYGRGRARLRPVEALAWR